MNDYPANSLNAISSYPGVTAGGKADQRQPEVQGQLAHLEKLLQGVQQGLATLTDRLASVTRNDVPQGVGSSGEVTAAKALQSVTQTEMGERVRTMALTATACNEGIQSILRRLEV